MAEMLGSALVQEAVSRGLSLGFSRREEKASQEHLVERLEMAVSELEFSLERVQELPIRHLSLLSRKKQIKLAYLKAMELLDRHKQLAIAASHEQEAQGVKRKLWNICAKNVSLKSSATLSTDDVRRFEWYADCAGKFVRDVESGCSLHHYTFCNPIVRHLLEGKTLRYYFAEQGNLRRGFFIWPTYSDERGVEAVLSYRFEDSTMTEKKFTLDLILGLSESTDIVGVAIKGLQLLTSEFNLVTECAMGELSMLYNLQDIAHSYGPPLLGLQERYIKDTQYFRPDPTCCEGNRDEFCANNDVSSELSDIFPEQVIHWSFECYYVPVVVPRSSCSSFDVLGRSKSKDGGKPPLLLIVAFRFAPHHLIDEEDMEAVKTIGDVTEFGDASTQQVAETLKSDAINCFFSRRELTKYEIFCRSKHGCAAFKVEKASMERAAAPKTKRRYNTRASQEVARTS